MFEINNDLKNEWLATFNLLLKGDYAKFLLALDQLSQAIDVEINFSKDDKRAKQVKKKIFRQLYEENIKNSAVKNKRIIEQKLTGISASFSAYGNKNKDHTIKNHASQFSEAILDFLAIKNELSIKSPESSRVNIKLSENFYKKYNFSEAEAAYIKRKEKAMDADFPYSLNYYELECSENLYLLNKENWTIANQKAEEGYEQLKKDSLDRELKFNRKSFRRDELTKLDRKKIKQNTLTFDSKEIQDKYQNFLSKNIPDPDQLNRIKKNHHQNIMSAGKEILVTAFEEGPYSTVVKDYDSSIDKEQGGVYINTIIKEVKYIKVDSNGLVQESGKLPGKLSVKHKSTDKGNEIVEVSASNHLLYQAILNRKVLLDSKKIVLAEQEENLYASLREFKRECSETQLENNTTATATAKIVDNFVSELTQSTKDFILQKKKSKQSIKNFSKAAKQLAKKTKQQVKFYAQIKSRIEVIMAYFKNIISYNKKTNEVSSNEKKSLRWSGFFQPQLLVKAEKIKKNVGSLKKGHMEAYFNSTANRR